MQTPPQSVLVGETGPDINQPVNQTTQPGPEPVQIGTMGNAPQDDIIFLLLEPIDFLMNWV